MPVHRLPPGRASSDVVAGLAHVLVDATEDGVSAGFLAPLPLDRAAQWWDRVLRSASGDTWVAHDAEGVVGCVRLVPAAAEADEHRAEVSKFLVLRRARGHGHGRELLDALEAHALATGRRLLTLDTETGTPAEALYERWGWERYGVVADHAARPDGVLAPTTFFVRRLPADRQPSTSSLPASCCRPIPSRGASSA